MAPGKTVPTVLASDSRLVVAHCVEGVLVKQVPTCMQEWAYGQDCHSCYRTPGSQKGFRRVSKGFQKGSLKGSLNGSLKGLEGFLKGSAEGPFQKTQNAFKNPPKTLPEGIEIDDALGFPGLQNQFQGPVAGNEEMKVLSASQATVSLSCAVLLKWKGEFKSGLGHYCRLLIQAAPQHYHLMCPHWKMLMPRDL